MRRSTRTFVLPEPAAAETSRLPPRFSTAIFCCRVSFSAMFVHLLRDLIPKTLRRHHFIIPTVFDCCCVANCAIGAVSARVVAATSGIWIGSNIAGCNLIHHVSKQMENISAEQLKLLTTCNISSNSSVFFPAAA